MSFNNSNNELIRYNYLFFYNKLKFLTINNNNSFLNFFRLSWFKNKIYSNSTKKFFSKIETNKLFSFNTTNLNFFNYFIKTKYINSNSFYNYNKNIINTNKNYFLIINSHFYFFKYFFLLISNIKHILFFNSNYKYLFKTNKIILTTNHNNNSSLLVGKNLRKKNIKNLLVFNELL